MPDAPSQPRLGVDVGGTFTDLVAWDGRALSVAKRPSTPPDFEAGVRAVIDAAGAAGAAGALVHGSTVVTNALLERRLPRAGLVTNRGFEDVLRIGRQDRPRLYDLAPRKPPPVIDRPLTFGVGGRLDAGGRELEPLDEADLAAAADALVAAGVAHAAVCLLFSFASDRHERRAGEILRGRGVTATLSCDVAGEFREFERASTTAATAALRPLVAGYLGRLRDALPARVTPVRILTGSGGTATPEGAAANAASLSLSGPAGGAAGAAYVARLAGFDDAVGLDVGGTSTDVALVEGGRPGTRHDHGVGGVPLRLAMLDIETVGAGGGSVAHLDAGGGLRVGPRSAGAVPGPACYGRGGAEPTVTDALLVLGRVPAGGDFGGLRPDAAAARAAVASLGLGDAGAVAEGIVRVAERRMADAVAAVAAARGRDARRLAVVGFGGAGGLHACNVADLLGGDTVVLPPMAGVLSALGMVVAPAAADAARTVLPLDRRGDLDDDRLYAEFGRLNARLLDAVPPGDLAAVECAADCRWRGQSHELTVAARRPSRDAIEAAFRDAYRRTYGGDAVPAGAAFEIVTLRLRRVGRAPRIDLPPLPNDHPRARLFAAGDRAGPLVIADADATAFVPAGWTAAMRPDGTVLCRRVRSAGG